MSASEPVIAFQGVVKEFGATLAVDGVDLDIQRGEIHALLGANGAGKSTLIKLLAGVYRPDGGAILFRGQDLSSRASGRAPISFIHQDLGLYDWMSVGENIAIVRGYPRRGGLISWRHVSRQAQDALSLLDADISPDTILGELSRADKTIVAIARALVAGSEVLVLDEPTATLPDAEVTRLFSILRTLRQAELTMIYVSHRLDEIFRIADRVSVLRDGRLIASNPIGMVTPADLVFQIAGRPPATADHAAPPATAVPLVEADGIEVGPVGPVSLAVRGGEILGLCGLRGAGHQSIGRVLSGVEPASAGTLRLRGAPVKLTSPRHALASGVAFVSGNRDDMLSATLTVQENLFLNPALFGRRLWQFRLPKDETRHSDTIVSKFLVKCSASSQPVTTLSGGNQQKLALARSLTIGTQMLVLEDPTQGVDVGSKADIYAMLRASLDRDHAVVIVSSDLEEVASQCDRALVFNRAGITAEVQPPDLTISRLTELVGGAAETSSVS
jgi:ribose transport system ATP-binding protein